MSYTNHGELICKKCKAKYIKSNMMDVDDEGTKSLIYCKECNGWREWEASE